METAKCTVDDREYRAGDFARLSDEVLEEYRRQLVCLGSGCNAPAYFRAKSKDRRAPCFASNSHTATCDARSTGEAAGGGGEEEEHQELVNLGNVLYIDNRPGSATAAHHDPDESGRPGDVTPRYAGTGTGDVASPAVSSKRLRPILRELLRSPAFADTDRVIRYSDWPEQASRYFFHHMPEVTAAHRNRRDGYWGTVVSFSSPSPSGLWLNFGPPGTASIFVPEEDVNPFLAWVDVADRESLVGTALIVLATLRQSQRGNLYIQLPKQTARTFLVPLLEGGFVASLGLRT